MKKIFPNLSVANCQEVLEYYKTVFGGEVKTYGWPTARKCSRGMKEKSFMPNCTSMPIVSRISTMFSKQKRTGFASAAVLASFCNWKAKRK